MGVDEALLEFAQRSVYDATLRLYAWEPACISLGFGQPYSDVDIEKIRSRGWGVVRRITGGRAILHTDELTYAVIGKPEGEHLKGDILQSYLQISKALLTALRSLGLEVEAKENFRGGTQEDKNPICYETPGAFEITVGGKKLVGSAQSRRSYGVLQHGSLPLGGEIARITQGLHYLDDEARAAAANRLNSKAITVETALGQTVDWETAASAFEKAFEESLDVSLEEGELGGEEARRAEELVGSKYRQMEWLQRI